MYKTRGDQNGTYPRLEDLINLFGGFVAGGCFKDYAEGGCFKDYAEGNKPKDVDLFFTDEDSFYKAKEAAKKMGCKQEYVNENATRFIVHGQAVEFIKTLFGDPESVIRKFDFTVCKFALYKDAGEFKAVYRPNFHIHQQNKVLHIDAGILVPISTFRRAFRYKGYGYSLDRSSELAIIDSLREIDEDDLSETFYREEDL